jgi:hypothetical protein
MKDILIPEQEYIRISKPSLSASLEFKQQFKIYENINKILIDDGIDEYLKSIIISEEKEVRNGEFYFSEQLKLQRRVSQCLRVNIAKNLCKCSFREFSSRLSDSNTLQWFCKFDGPDTIKLPSKSKLNTLCKIISTKIILKTIDLLLYRMGNESTSLENKIDLTSLYADSTCVKLNVHHPVDWVLLRDAIRSIVRSINTIRSHGLKHRINPPDNFLKLANRISINMTMTGSLRKASSKKKRKDLLRDLKNLMKVMERHGVRYIKLLNKAWHKSDLSKHQAEQISGRLIKVIDQVDDIIFQAHERIIGERKFKNKDKILSLYEGHVQVYKRGKAGADIEFGIQLFIAETEQGLIANWHLRNAAPQNDTKFIVGCIEQTEEAGFKPKYFTGDRGFISKSTEKCLSEKSVVSYICPKNIITLRKKMAQKRFKK